MFNNAWLSQLKTHGSAEYITGIIRGIEKENLRVTLSGKVAQTDHPKALGSALTHPSITTDFSESLLEMVTPPVHGLENLMQALQELQAVIYRHLDQELLWPASMPPQIDQQEDIRLAHYGTSNSGTLKHIYRRGLSYRYGRIMQAIAGIHYNISFPDALFKAMQLQLQDQKTLQEFRSQRYLGAIRQYFRHYWLLAYLFGASPACMQSSVRGEMPPFLAKTQHQTLVGEYATCLRMSRLGYQNPAQTQLNIQFNDLHTYADSLLSATRKPYAPFADLGVKVDGEYRQLNDSILQIENEYYSPIRPKQIVERGERPAVALKKRGVAYLEVRVLDLNPLLPLGIDIDQMAFMDLFMLHCLLSAQETICYDRCQEAWNNFSQVATLGRKPGVLLTRNCQTIRMQEWAEALFAELRELAQWLDQSNPRNHYIKAWEKQYQKLQYSEQTPSAQLLSALTQHQQNYTELCLTLAQQQRQAALATPVVAQRLAYYQQLAQESWAEQRALEADSVLPFETYLQKFLGGY